MQQDKYLTFSVWQKKSDLTLQGIQTHHGVDLAAMARRTHTHNKKKRHTRFCKPINALQVFVLCMDVIYFLIQNMFLEVIYHSDFLSLCNTTSKAGKSLVQYVINKSMEMPDLNYYSYSQAFLRSTWKAGCEDKPVFCHFILPPLMPVYIE